MRLKLSAPQLFLFSLLCVSSTALAQQNSFVQLEGTKMRAPLEVPKGTSTVSICGLLPGNTYTVIASGMAYGQKSTFEIAPAPVLTHGASNFAFMRESKNAIRFAAPTACVDIQVQANSPEQGENTPLYLSIKCLSCPEANEWLRGTAGQENLSVLEVQEGFSAQHLVENVLVGGGCFQISNVSYFGQGNQIGTFSNGQSNIGIGEGLIMATGGIIVAPGPNDSDGASAGFGTSSPDGDLQTLTTGPTFDKAAIEFDFVPTQNQVLFEFAFASEEYCEYVNTQFNDVFGFFISGPGINGTKNIALIPNTTTPITINNLNHLVNTNLYVHNTPFFGNNCIVVPPAFGPAVQELQYDGFTKKMTAVASVIPCEKYHIKLAIADVGDGVWDSAVFLRANSFSAGGEVLASPGYPGGFSTAYESCDAGSIRFARGNSDLSQPLAVSFTVAGTATPGIDYVPLSSPVIIPAGESEILVPVQVIPDFIPEGQENIILLVDNSCSCTQGVVEFLINDRPTLYLEASDQFLCEGELATLQATVSGGLPNVGYDYHWSTGETSAEIHPSSTGTYTLTVTDGCSVPAAVSIELVFSDCDCQTETFVKSIGQAGEDVRGYGVFNSEDGNLYITGLKQDSAAIIKMTPAGAVLWMRTFDIINGANDNISELIIDSDGRIAGCGTSGDAQPGTSGFVFRYDPVTNTMLWANTYSIESPYVIGIAELPNGNYAIFDNPNQPESTVGIKEISRPDGLIVPGSPLNHSLNLGSLDHFNSAVLHNGKIFGVGRYTNGSDFTDMRHALTSIDLATGNVDWSRLSHVGANAPARLYGMDLLIENDQIISVGLGSEIDDNLNNSRIFLQKNDLDGNLIWVRRFDLDASIDAADEIISVPDGFIIYARDGGVPSDLYLLKTDKDGTLEWSKKVNYGFQDFVGVANTFQSQILLKDNHLFFVASSQNPGENSQMMVAKTTLDGTVEGDCDFIQPTLVAFSNVLNPVSFSVDLQEVSQNESLATIVQTPNPTDLLVENQCEVFVDDQVSISLCPGESVTIDNVSFSQDTTFSVNIPGSGGCDTLRTYTIEVLPFQIRTEDISFCPGSSVTIGGQVYDQSGTVVDTLPGIGGGCDTIVTYNLTLLPQPTYAETILFCPGESVALGGNVYSQPETVVLTLPAASSAGECDTIATYTLQFATPAPSTVNIACPGSITIGQPSGSGGTVVDFASPTASSDCVCPGLSLEMTSGLPSGSNFPQGITTVCYLAKDSCGQSATCCFTVTIGEEEPCDTKVNGCVKYELLTITEDQGKNRTYRIRVTNNCSNKLIYTAIQVPNGLLAIEPANFSTYTAPSGNTYLVRSPNYSPQYSVRYSSVSDSINNGESDIFRYTLPAQADVTYIHVVSRLVPYMFVGAHLNTFYCPIGITTDNARPEGSQRSEEGLFEFAEKESTLFVFPNPTSSELFADLSAWQGERLNIHVLDSRGQTLQRLESTAVDEAQPIDLPEHLPSGLYFLEVLTERGHKASARFAIQR